MQIEIEYFALLREEAGCASETIELQQPTPAAVYACLNERHAFSLPAARLRVAVNDRFTEWNTQLDDGDRVVFIPPVAGG
ncbi:MAG: MoaD/ThiS family protein [Gammaproteobacteria bacterium]|nr:MoaD/ThiS family protein [Gammaproteobacteria bacterium]NND59998.1 MoaD/ThiS family protein [Gammaproteobacteria bacterium]